MFSIHLQSFRARCSRSYSNSNTNVYKTGNRRCNRNASHETGMNRSLREPNTNLHSMMHVRGAHCFSVMNTYKTHQHKNQVSKGRHILQD
ncbi:hypothetical protein Hanom_Chr07g00648651 [Helianthus anomalus]